MLGRVCELNGCVEKHYAKGLCATHYRDMRKVIKGIIITTPEEYITMCNKAIPKPEVYPHMQECIRMGIRNGLKNSKSDRVSVVLIGDNRDHDAKVGLQFYQCLESFIIKNLGGRSEEDVCRILDIKGNRKRNPKKIKSSLIKFIEKMVIDKIEKADKALGDQRELVFRILSK